MYLSRLIWEMDFLSVEDMSDVLAMQLPKSVGHGMTANMVQAKARLLANSYICSSLFLGLSNDSSQ